MALGCYVRANVLPSLASKQPTIPGQAHTAYQQRFCTTGVKHRMCTPLDYTTVFACCDEAYVRTAHGLRTTALHARTYVELHNTRLHTHLRELVPPPLL